MYDIYMYCIIMTYTTFYCHPRRLRIHVCKYVSKRRFFEKPTDILKNLNNVVTSVASINSYVLGF
jgi:hypothetical protein